VLSTSGRSNLDSVHSSPSNSEESAVSVRNRPTCRDLRATGSRAFAELLIDSEEIRTLLAMLVGMLREADRSGPSF